MSVKVYFPDGTTDEVSGFEDFDELRTYLRTKLRGKGYKKVAVKLKTDNGLTGITPSHFPITEGEIIVTLTASGA